MPTLDCIDQATGLPVRKAPPRRYEKTRPGELVHLTHQEARRGSRRWRVESPTVEALARIVLPAVNGNSTPGPPGPEVSRNGATGTGITGIDDDVRVVYSDILDDERKHTAADFWSRAAVFFDSLGIAVEAVMTDNGSCYRSHVFADALGEGVTHRFTRAYRPQTNGKVE